ncbi:wax ester synthase/diacylglycerol acyltransferase 4-like [Aristolochia californica]|uniref:wax ester synthase/diacylglycerol acyltransferase 4-like n=1 Tax=Aristolochia californica TaxID=171875 RepID=UPI0035E2C82D
MASGQSRQAAAIVDNDDYQHHQPLSPNSLAYTSSALSVSILCMFESEVPFDDDTSTYLHLGDLCLNSHPRFSSVIINDRSGTARWKKITVNLEDHVKVPRFPGGMSPDEYSNYFQEYLSKICNAPFREGIPMWEIHICNYPTRDAAGSIVIRLHHALGDGFTLMGALMSFVKRADDPSLPLTFPSSSKQRYDKKTVFSRLSESAQRFWDTASDVVWSAVESRRGADDGSAIRSGNVEIVSVPICSTRLVLPLDQVHEVKSKIDATINDVVLGMIFYGIHLYNHKMNQTSSRKRMTALVTVNTRKFGGYQPVKDMLEANSSANSSTTIDILIPSCDDVEKVDPLIFILEAQKAIKRKRNSMMTVIKLSLFQMLCKIKGAEVVGQQYYHIVNNSSMIISNLIGPKEKMKVSKYLLKNFYFFLTGCPIGIVANVMSYCGHLTLVVTIEKDFIAPEMLINYINEAFERIYAKVMG